VGAMIHADEQTGMRKLIVAFHNFENTPKKVNMERMTITTCACFYSVQALYISNVF
jgi:3-dehydroquinate dehydratase